MQLQLLPGCAVHSASKIAVLTTAIAGAMKTERQSQCSAELEVQHSLVCRYAMLGLSFRVKSRGTNTSWLSRMTPTAYDDTGSSTWLDLQEKHEDPDRGRKASISQLSRAEMATSSESVAVWWSWAAKQGWVQHNRACRMAWSVRKLDCSCGCCCSTIP